MHHLTLRTLSVNLVVLVLYAVDSIKARQNKDAVGPQLFLWSPSLLLPAFTMSIDHEIWRFLPAYRNNFKRWLTAYSICTLQTPHSKQICFIISSALWRCAVTWTCGRRCDREIAREPGYWFHLSPPMLPLVNRCLLIPTVELFHALPRLRRGRVMRGDISRSSSPPAATTGEVQLHRLTVPAASCAGPVVLARCEWMWSGCMNVKQAVADKRTWGPWKSSPGE